MKRQITTHLVALLVLALTLGACGQRNEKRASETPANSADKSAREKQVVATIGQKKITVGELERRLARQKDYVRMRFSSPERKKVFLEKVVRFEVLVAEAKRRKLENHPEVVERVKRAMVDQLVRDLNREMVKLSDITEAEVKARYERDKAKFSRPAMVRGAHIVVESEAKAKKLLAQLRQAPKNPKLFGKLAKEHSVDAGSKARFGDLGFLHAKSKNVPAPVLKALLGLETLWAVAGPIPVDKKFHLLMRTGNRKAVVRPLSTLTDRIKNQLFHEKRYEAIKGFTEKLRKKAKVEIDQAALAKVRIRREVPKLNLPPSQRSAVMGGKESAKKK